MTADQVIETESGVLRYGHLFPVSRKKSFIARIHELNSSCYWLWNDKPVSPRAFFLDKTKAHDLLSSLDVGAPRLYVKSTLYSDINLPINIDRFAIKPNRGVGSKGCYLVQKKGEHFSCWDVAHAKTLDFSQVREKVVEFSKWRRSLSRWIIEELVFDKDFPDRPPVDYKFYTFMGRSPLLLVKDNFRRGYAWVDQSGCAVSTGVYEDKKLDPICLPSNLQELFTFAEKVSCRIPAPMVRVDVFNSSNGPIVGEITPAPSLPKRIFTPQWERVLMKELDVASTTYLRQIS